VTRIAALVFMDICFGLFLEGTTSLRNSPYYISLDARCVPPAASFEPLR
jgi:hypothetical protein